MYVWRHMYICVCTNIFIVKMEPINHSYKAFKVNLSRLGHVIEDIQVLISGLRCADVGWVKRSANLVAKNISDDVIWLEDSPPPALESLYHDCLAIMEWNFGSSFQKKKIYIFKKKNVPSTSSLLLSKLEAQQIKLFFCQVLVIKKILNILRICAKVSLQFKTISKSKPI